MIKRIFMAAVLGGLIAFIWGNISWVVLDWHLKAMHQFKDESAVAAVLKNNAPESGVYMLPQMPNDSAARVGEDHKTLKEKHDAQVSEGPRAYVSLAQGPGDPTMK
ncbi:MAG: hypothetical protein M3R00_04770, partial [Pseudomonadota bacterium]|nr:hypothetical protein [Pseudomonadota bacterium]